MALTRFRFPAVVWAVNGAIRRLARSSRRRSSVGGPGRTLNRSPGADWIGYSSKKVITETSKIDIRIPCDRDGTLDPKLIAKYQRRFPVFGERSCRCIPAA